MYGIIIAYVIIMALFFGAIYAFYRCFGVVQETTSKQSNFYQYLINVRSDLSHININLFL